MSTDVNESITHLGLLDDDEIVLDHAALLLAALDHPGVDLVPYHELLDDLAVQLADHGGDGQLASDQAVVLAGVIADENGFLRDAESYDDPANTDLIRVIDRRRGLPVALANRGTLVRLLTNQAERARSIGSLKRALTLYTRMTMVDPGSTPLWWRRAALEREFGLQEAAQASLRAILETTRDPDVRARVRLELANGSS